MSVPFWIDRSEWHTPDAPMRTITSPARGGSSVELWISSGSFSPTQTAAFGMSVSFRQTGPWHRGSSAAKFAVFALGGAHRVREDDRRRQHGRSDQQAGDDDRHERARVPDDEADHEERRSRCRTARSRCAGRARSARAMRARRRVGTRVLVHGNQPASSSSRAMSRRIRSYEKCRAASRRLCSSSSASGSQRNASSAAGSSGSNHSKPNARSSRATG